MGRSAYLPGHRTGVPALRFSLLKACRECRRGNIAVARVTSGSGLADDELVELEAVVRKLEQGGARKWSS